MTVLILLAAWSVLVALALAVLHRLSPERDRQDQQSPTPQKEQT